MSRLLAFTNTTGMSIWDAASEPEQVPGLGAAAVKALRAIHGRRCTCCASAPSRGRPIAELLKEVLQETGYLEALEAERTIEAQGRLENLEELINVAAEYDSAHPLARMSGENPLARIPEPGSLADFLEQIALDLRCGRSQRRRGLVTLMTLHNAKGLEYPIVFMIGLRGGRVPALAGARRGRPRGGAPPLLRGHHARAARPVPDVRPHPHRVRRPQLRRAEPVHRRDPRGADRRRATTAARPRRCPRPRDDLDTRPPRAPATARPVVAMRAGRAAARGVPARPGRHRIRNSARAS